LEDSLKEERLTPQGRLLLGPGVAVARNRKERETFEEVLSVVHPGFGLFMLLLSDCLSIINLI
jgi:hypothetical protein